MSTPIVLFRAPTEPEMRFSRSETGHVHSCWFSFDLKGSSLCDYDSNYHRIIAQAKSAFAAVLGIQESEVIVTRLSSMAETFENQFRLGTKHPVQLPQKPTKLRDTDAIDV